MRAAMIKAFGEPMEVLELVDVPEPTGPAAGEVLVGVEYAPINMNDLYVIEGALLAVVALSLISSVLIVWLYVGRNIVARLTALSDRMLTLAQGDLKSPLPQGGTDEVGRMAEALGYSAQRPSRCRKRM